MKFIFTVNRQKNTFKNYLLPGVLTLVEDHDTSYTLTNPDGTQLTIQIYPKPKLLHNQAMDWVNDTNNNIVIPLHSLLFGGQSGGFSGKSHLFWK